MKSIKVIEALKEQRCVKCGGIASYFTSRRKIRIYRMIGYCQDCQDGVNK